MLLFSVPFMLKSSAKPPRVQPASPAANAPRIRMPVAVPDTARRHGAVEVDGLGHYIDSRLCGERFRID